MAKFELNIYGENDEILKKYETDIVRWGVFLKAVKLQDEIKGKGAAEQLEAVSEFAKSIFAGLTDEDLAMADGSDVFNTFKQLVKQANAIGAGSKNA